VEEEEGKVAIPSACFLVTWRASGNGVRRLWTKHPGEMVDRHGSNIEVIDQIITLIVINLKTTTCDPVVSIFRPLQRAPAMGDVITAVWFEDVRKVHEVMGFGFWYPPLISLLGDVVTAILRLILGCANINEAIVFGFWHSPINLLL
jgi:hypothetical protein